jgi:hypothetical protein
VCVCVCGCVWVCVCVCVCVCVWVCVGACGWHAVPFRVSLFHSLFENPTVHTFTGRASPKLTRFHVQPLTHLAAPRPTIRSTRPLNERNAIFVGDPQPRHCDGRHTCPKKSTCHVHVAHHAHPHRPLGLSLALLSSSSSVDHTHALVAMTTRVILTMPFSRTMISMERRQPSHPPHPPQHPGQPNPRLSSRGHRLPHRP